MTEPGSNLARVLALWGEMSNGQTMAPLGEAMAEDVVWQGVLPELVCHGLTEVREVLGSARGGRLPRVTRMEAEEAGDRVVVTVEGPTSAQAPRARRSSPSEGHARWPSGSKTPELCAWKASLPAKRLWA